MCAYSFIRIRTTFNITRLITNSTENKTAIKNLQHQTKRTCIHTLEHCYFLRRYLNKTRECNFWQQQVKDLPKIPTWSYCIVFIHLYSASCSAHQSEALPVRETQREEARVGFEPDTLRMQGTEATTEPLHPTLSQFRSLFNSSVNMSQPLNAEGPQLLT